MQRAFLMNAKNYFFWHSLAFSFSFLEQSNFFSSFLSSILPPPWLPAKDAVETNINADTSAVAKVFMFILSN